MLATFDPASNVCLATIMTQERVPSLHKMLEVWDGWVSIGMLVNAGEYASAAAAGLDQLRHGGQPVPAPERVALSLVQDVGYRRPHNRFPYNLLRNAALARCEAEYVLVTDVDFVPFPARPSARLRRWITELDVRPGSPNVLVIPAFEQVGMRPDPTTARSLTKPALLNLTASGDLISFASGLYESGHVCDQPARFLSASQPFQTQYQFGCEPYTVLPRRGMHPYEERFVGYGKNRVSWNYEMGARRLTLRVVPDVFLVHFWTVSPNASKYGHFSRDWMVGEACWPSFRDRVQKEYNYSVYNCHQRHVDIRASEIYPECVSDVERLCVAPHCAPPITAFLPPVAGGPPRRATLPGRPYSAPAATPPPPSAAAPLRYPGPSMVLLGSEGCGVPALWLAIRTKRHLEGGGTVRLAATGRSMLVWRRRLVQFADREANYILGDDWYRRRWPIPEGSPDVGMDGSGSYLHSSAAALRLPRLLAPKAKLVVVLSDPLTRTAKLRRGIRGLDAAMYAEAMALARCFEAAGGGTGAAWDGKGTGAGGGVGAAGEGQTGAGGWTSAAGAGASVTGWSLSHGAWDRCTAVVCGSPGCAVGGGVYAPQISGWLRTAPQDASWLILPAEAMADPFAAQYALSRLGIKVSSPDCPLIDVSAASWAALRTALNPSDAVVAAIRAGGGIIPALTPHQVAQTFDSAAARLGPAKALLTVFFARYNAQLESLIQTADPASGFLWREVAWLPRGNVSAEAVTAAAVRFTQHRTGGVPPAPLTIASRSWLGPFPPPTVFLLGARESGYEPLAEALLGLNGSCGGALHVFDDDARYTKGLARALSPFRRGLNVAASPCARVVDTSPYLHTRWAPFRVSAALAPAVGVRLVVVLHEPAERAMRHWQRMRPAGSNRGAAGHWPGRKLGEASGGRAVQWGGRAATERSGGTAAEPLLRDAGSRRLAAHGYTGPGGGEQSRSRQLDETLPTSDSDGPELAASLEKAVGHVERERPEGHIQGQSTAAPHANGTLPHKARAEMKGIGQCLEQRIAARTAAAGANGDAAGGAVAVAAGGANGGADTGHAAAGAAPDRRVPPLLSSEPSADDWRFCTTTQCNWLNCPVGTGLYSPQLRGWLASFSPNQMLLLEASQLKVEPQLVASLVQAFLAVPSLGKAAAGMAEAGRADHQTNKQALADLQVFYAPHNRNVRRLFDALAPPGAWQKAPWLQAPSGLA